MTAPSRRSPRARAAALSVTLSVALLLTGACSAAPPAPGGTGQEIRVAAASDLKFALDEAVEVFEAEHDGVEVEVAFGSSGTFVQQIRNGAPFDLYLSADISLAEELAEEGRARPQDVFGYAVGRLVVWAAEGSTADPRRGVAGLAEDAVTTVAIAHPEHAPYGRAAEAAVRTAGVEEELEGKLVLGENIAQAAGFARSGNADAGIIALSLALSPGLRDEGTYSEVPLEDFPTLEQGGVVLEGAPQEARDLAAFLTSPGGREILAEHGFYPPAGAED